MDKLYDFSYISTKYFQAPGEASSPPNNKTTGLIKTKTKFFFVMTITAFLDPNLDLAFGSGNGLHPELGL